MMRLLKLELENWSCHDSLEADLERGLQIEGRNGTGKSSILEAIRFVFKETARGYTNRIRNGERRASVKLSFSDGGHTYLVEKSLYVDKASTASMIQGDTQVADNPSSVHKRLQNILSEDVLEKLLYIPQDGLTNILDRLSGREGKLEFDRLFGLDKLERVWERTGQEIQDSESKLEVYADELKKHPENAEDDFKDRISEFSASVSRVEENASKLTEDMEKVKEHLSRVEGELKRLGEAKRSIDSLNKRKGALQVVDAETRKELESLRDRIKKVDVKRKDLSTLTVKKRALERYKGIREGLHELRSTGDRLEGLKDLKGRKERLLQLEELLKEKDKVREAYERGKSGLKALEDELSNHMNELKRLADYYSQLGGLEGQAKCPRCGQRLNAFVMEREKVETAQEIKSVEEHRRMIEAQLNEVRESVDPLKEKIERFREWEAEAKHLRSEVGGMEAKAVEYLKRQQEIRARMEKLGYSGEELPVVEEKFMELTRVSALIKSLIDEVEGEERLKDKVEKLEAKHAGIAEEMRAVEKQLSQTSYDEGEHRDRTKNRDRLSDSKYRIKSDLKSLSAEVKMLKAEKKALKDRLIHYYDLRKKHDDAMDHVRMLKSAREVFHRDKGLVKYLRERFIVRLNSLLTQHFKRFNTNPRYVDVSFDRDYNILLRTTSGDLSVSQLSGGERAQLALALRVALIDLLSPIPLLILDEPFGSLDEAHREILGESLNKLSEQGQLLIVTHVHVDSLQLQNRIDLGGY
ncbi:MAG: AAA family ATPase [Candidatus Altiarchaeales archaeon]|nr:AAA family ATPase [Candidatus Altiarchaeales archaeon]MBD3416214.1 AAA family ATPase [Candidatus Altiarchaeales archaeon]